MSTTTTPARKGFQLGSTLYSFTNEWHERRYGFGDLIAEVARRSGARMGKRRRCWKYTFPEGCSVFEKL